jgi:hypothetical protein
MATFNVSLSSDSARLHGYIALKAAGREAVEYLPSNTWREGHTYNYTMKMSPANKLFEIWTGLRNSWYGATSSEVAPPDLGDAGTYPYPAPASWGSALTSIRAKFSNVPDKTMLLLVGEVDTGAYLTDYGAIMWFRKPASAPRDPKIAYEPKPGLDLHKLLRYCDDHNIRVYLQVESGMADVSRLMDIVMGEFGGAHKSVAGFMVDLEWYQNAEDGNDGTPMDNATAKMLERQLKCLIPYLNANGCVNRLSKWQFGLKHFDSEYLPRTYRGDILFINDSQGFASVDAMKEELGDWAEHFAPNDIWYQQGYADDHDLIWHQNEDPNAIADLGNILFALGRPGQKVGFLWVDFTMRHVLRRYFPEE